MILGVFAAIGITGFGAEMFRIAIDGTPRLREMEFHRLSAGNACRRQQTTSQAGIKGGGSPMC